MKRAVRFRVAQRVRRPLLALLIGSALLMACESTGDQPPPSVTPAPPGTDPFEGLSIADWFKDDDEDDDDDDGGVRQRNIILVENRTNGRFMFRSDVDLRRTRNRTVTPLNIAEARASCVDCQTIAVAVQIVLYRQGANNVSPENYAVALNVQCTRCVTVARAIQYVIPVDDPTKVPRDVEGLVRDLDRELGYFERFDSVRDIDAAEAERRINRILSQYESLKAYLKDFRDEKQAGETSTPTPVGGTETPAPISTETPTPTPNATSTAAGQ